MRILTVSGNSMNEIQGCDQYWHFSKEEHLEPLASAAALDKGWVMHRMLERYYNGIIVRREYQLHYDNEYLVDDAITYARCALAKELDLQPEQFEEVVKHFRDYCHNYVDDSWVPLAVEKAFSKVMYVREDTPEEEGITILYEGLIDLIIRNPAGIFPVDHKTGERKHEPELLSNAFFGYNWAMGTNNLIVNKIGFQKTLKPKERMQRHILPYPQPLIDEWVQNTIRSVEAFDRRHRAGIILKNFTHCDKYGGCIYRFICRSEEGARAWRKAKQYRVVPSTSIWDGTPREDNNE
jgi:PD-(D/E)XK nuclease superfamily